MQNTAPQNALEAAEQLAAHGYVFTYKVGRGMAVTGSNLVMRLRFEEWRSELNTLFADTVQAQYPDAPDGSSFELGIIIE